MTLFYIRILIVLVFLNSSFCQVNRISKKGSKYAEKLRNERLRKNSKVTPMPTTTSAPQTTTEDPFFSSDNDIFSDFDDAFEGLFLKHVQKFDKKLKLIFYC